MIEESQLYRQHLSADEIEARQTDSLVASSRGREWRGLKVFVHRNHVQEVDLPPCSEHFLGVNLDAIDKLFQAHGRRVREGPLGPAELLLVPAGTACRWHWKTPTNCVNVYLQPGFVNSVAEDLCAGSHRQIEMIDSFGFSDPVLLHLALALKYELDFCQRERLYGESLATALTVHLLRNYSALPPGDNGFRGGLAKARLRQVTDYMEANLGRDISLAELSEVAQLSASHFARAFKQSTGVSPHRFLLQRRIERSKELLARPDVTIAEVSLQLGFTDQSHFTGVFHQMVGMTPRQYLDRR